MKLINAFWEIRNTGITTEELSIDYNDDLKSILELLGEMNAAYRVIKIPISRFDICKVLMNKGYSFIETIIRVAHNLKDIKCPDLIKRIARQVTYKDMGKADIDLMNAQIKNGMFNTDRVSLDSFFTKEQAASRYINWMKDELERNARLLVFKYKNKPIGFGCIKETEPKVYYPVLGGVYNINGMLPMGAVIALKELDIIKELGGKRMYTYISSNNVAVVRMYSEYGYIFEEMKYTFIKHVNTITP